MPRPKGDAQERLLEAARALALERGCGALCVREVCRRSRVNLGLFHYHFKSKDAFIKRVLEDVYAEFFAELSKAAEESGPVLARLRGALRVIALFAREHRRLFVGLLRDAVNGNKLTLEFAASRFPHHLPLVMGLIRDGVRDGRLRDLPEPVLLSVLMGAISVPALMFTLLEDAGAKLPFGKSMSEVEKDLLSDRSIELRLDLALAALKSPSRRGR